MSEISSSVEPPACNFALLALAILILIIFDAFAVDFTTRSQIIQAFPRISDFDFFGAIID